MAKGGGLDKLSALVQSAGQPLTKEEQEEMAADEEQLAADVKKVLDYAEKLVGKEGGIFDMQVLVEACAEELRNQIRDEAEGGDDDA